MAAFFGRRGAVGAAALVTAATYVTYGAGLLATMLIARDVGPLDYGHYAYLVWMSGLLVIVANNGISTAAIRFVSEARGGGSSALAADVHGWLQVRHHASIAATSAVFLGVALLSTNWEHHLALFAALVVVSGASKADYIFTISVAKGHGQFKVEALTAAACGALGVALAAAVFVSGHGDLIHYAALFAVVSIVHPLLARLWLRRAGIASTSRPLPATLRGRVADHVLWTSAVAATGVFGPRSVEIYLLNAMGHLAEVGFFAIATALARGGVDLLASGLASVVAPAMAHAFGAGGLAPVRALYRDTSRYYHAIGLVLAGVGWFWAPAAITVLYGAQYAAAADALRVMVLVGGVALSYGAGNAFLMTTDNNRARLVFFVLSIVASLVFGPLLIPTWGYHGALASYAISMLITFGAVVVIVWRVLDSLPPLREFGLLTASAAGSGLALWHLLGADPAPWLQMAAGIAYVIAFFAISVAVGAWRRGDYRALAKAARGNRRLRPLRRLLLRLAVSSRPEATRRQGASTAPGGGDAVSVVHVVDSLESGGLERFVADLAMEQARRGDRVAVFSINRTEGLRGELEAAGVRVVQGGKSRTLDTRVLSALRALVGEAPGTVVHAHNYVPAYYAAFALALHRDRPRLVVTCHDMGDRLGNRKLQRLFQRGVARAGTVAAVSRQVGDALVARGAVPAAKLRVVTNGIPIERFRLARAARAEVRRTLGMTEDATVIGAVGRLVALKNHGQLIEAMPELLRRATSVRLVIAGDGPLRTELGATVERLGLSQQVLLLGESREVPQLLAAFDIYAQPSLTEGLSIALLEACASARAIVCSDAGGNVEIVEDGRTGLVVPTGDADALTRTLASLVDDAARRRQLGDAAAAWVEAHGSITAVAATYRSMYRSLPEWNPSLSAWKPAG